MDSPMRIRARLGKPLPRERAARRLLAAGEGRPGDALARRLAFAHHIERLIDDGQLRNYADAAARLGISRARLSQLMDLALLPVAIQEEILRSLRKFRERELRTLTPWS